MSKNRNVGLIFGLQLSLIAFLTILFTEIGYYIIIGFANDILVVSLRDMSPTKILLDLEFLSFKTEIAIFGAILVVVLAVISYIVPMVKIYGIKPVQIIKVRE